MDAIGEYDKAMKAWRENTQGYLDKLRRDGILKNILRDSVITVTVRDGHVFIDVYRTNGKPEETTTASLPKAYPLVSYFFVLNTRDRIVGRRTKGEAVKGPVFSLYNKESADVLEHLTEPMPF